MDDWWWVVQRDTSDEDEVEEWYQGPFAEWELAMEVGRRTALHPRMWDVDGHWSVVAGPWDLCGRNKAKSKE